ncbi:unnamed protein product [Camellia sinensis]
MDISCPIFGALHMLCIIFEKDRATGKDAVTADDVLEKVSRNESIDTQNSSVEKIDTLSNASINDEGNSNKGKKRKNSSESSDAFREAAMIISTKIEEATDKFSRALCGFGYSFEEGQNQRGALKAFQSMEG